VKRIITADTHLSIYGNDKLKEGISERLYDIFSMLKVIAQYALEHRITEINIIGDVFNDKDIIYTKSMVLLTTFLEKYRNLNFVLLTGNHDLDNTSEDQVSILQSIDYENVTCIIAPVTFNNITYIPYSRNVVKDVETAEPNDILISHFGLNEGVLNSGISMISDIGIKQLKNFKLVLLGHYHKPQQMTNGVTNLWYTGSPIQKDWGEKHDEKRFLVLDDVTLEVESIPLKGYTKYIELVIEEDSDVKEIIEKSKELRSEGHHVRVRNKGKKGVEADDIQIINEVEEDITNRGIDLSMSLTEKAQKYMEIKEIPEEEHKKYMTVLKQTLNS